MEEIEKGMTLGSKRPSLVRADITAADIGGELLRAIAEVEREVRDLEEAKIVDPEILQREISI